ncbi:hypothetical protein [Saccharothrix hoggarensis]|uniref:Uncharacterized protein n=1 Tax=Saccharothrix hoggarensis TaxID=913853 RepID=A0ABW3R4Q7_9PSEU
MDGRRLATFPAAGHTDVVFASRTRAAVIRDDHVVLWNRDSAVATLVGHNAGAIAAFSPDGKTIATGVRPRLLVRLHDEPDRHHAVVGVHRPLPCS